RITVQQVDSEVDMVSPDPAATWRRRPDEGAAYDVPGDGEGQNNRCSSDALPTSYSAPWDLPRADSQARHRPWRRRFRGRHAPRIGLIDIRAQAEVPGALRTDTAKQVTSVDRTEMRRPIVFTTPRVACAVLPNYFLRSVDMSACRSTIG